MIPGLLDRWMGLVLVVLGSRAGFAKGSRFPLVRVGMVDFQVFPLGSIAAIVFLYVLAGYMPHKFDHIPAIGYSGPVTSYLGALRYFRRGKEVIMRGYKKYPNGIFRVPHLLEWLVCCSGQQFIEEIRKASDGELSISASIDEMLQVPYTIGQDMRDDSYILGVIRHVLPRNLAACFPDIFDEMQQSFDANLTLTGSEWKAFNAMPLILSVVCRTTNRIIVGLPLCRNPEYLDINTNFTKDVNVTAYTLRPLPRFLRLIVGRFISKLGLYRKRMHRLVADMLQERLEMEDQHGSDWAGKPNDMTSWLIDKAPPARRNVDDLVGRILTINFSGIHTTSLNFAHALYHLAAEPEHAAILREEVDAVIKEDGWTKAALDRLIKVDSFLKESQRVNGLGTLMMSRVALKDFTFSNGIVIPAGTTVTVPMYAIHHDETLWPDPFTFDPYRSSREREKDDADAKQQLVTSSFEFLPWGYGRYACPGRFFAANELKMMLAYVMHTYDVKFKQAGVRPANEWFGEICLPNQSAEVVFRKRTKPSAI